MVSFIDMRRGEHGVEANFYAAMETEERAA